MKKIAYTLCLVNPVPHPPHPEGQQLVGRVYLISLEKLQQVHSTSHLLGITRVINNPVAACWNHIHCSASTEDNPEGKSVGCICNQIIESH